MTKEKQKKSDEIVINLDTLAIPGAIILAGIIIAGAIFFTNKGTSNSGIALGDIDSNPPQAQEEEFPQTQTTISDSPYVGDRSKAKVAIVEFTDYQCPYCQRHNDDTMSRLIKDYVDSGDAIYVFREFPLEFHGQLAIDSANATLCVNEISGIDTFLKFHSKAFMVSSVDDLSDSARDLGVDMNRYNACMTENRYGDDIDRDLQEGMQAGVQGTPGFVVGVLESDGTVKGKLVAGAYPYDSFKSILDEYLK